MKVPSRLKKFRTGRPASGGPKLQSSESGHSMMKIIMGISTAAIAAAVGAWLIPVPGEIKKALQEPPPPQPSQSPISASVKRWSPACGSAYVLPFPIEEAGTPPPTDTDEWSTWGPSLGAADARYTALIVNVKSRTAEPVVVTGLNFTVGSRAQPIDGPTIQNPCGGPITGRYVEASLDTDPPRVVSSSSDPQAYVGARDLSLEQLKFPYRVTNTDTETLIVVGGTDSCDVYWTGELLWSNGEQNGSLTLDMEGKPFRTSAVIGPEYSYSDGWQEAPTPPTAVSNSCERAG